MSKEKFFTHYWLLTSWLLCFYCYSTLKWQPGRSLWVRLKSLRLICDNSNAKPACQKWKCRQQSRIFRLLLMPIVTKITSSRASKIPPRKIRSGKKSSTHASYSELLNESWRLNTIIDCYNNHNEPHDATQQLYTWTTINTITTLRHSFDTFNIYFHGDSDKNMNRHQS